jgi:hypothetical protein
MDLGINAIQGVDEPAIDKPPEFAWFGFHYFKWSPRRKAASLSAIFCLTAERFIHLIRQICNFGIV